MHAADATTPIKQTRDRLVQLIRAAGCVPVERDALYNVIHTFDPALGPRPLAEGSVGGAAVEAGRDVRPTRGVVEGATGLPAGLHNDN